MSSINYNGAVDIIRNAFIDGSKTNPVNVDVPTSSDVSRSISERTSVLLYQRNLDFVLREAYDSTLENAVRFLSLAFFARTFFQNDTGNDIKIRLNGHYFTLKDGYAYACQPSEWLLIKQQNHELEICDSATWWNLADEDLFVFYS
ncbi:MAG: hypothetical protein KBA02_00130 [Paludibacteraceae bacterium]|nr:hypothetical protein [Paludibacteraceae bacterium]